jgi:hypothetical protein
MKLATKIMARVIFLPLIFAAGLAVTALVTIRVMFTPEDLHSIVTNQFQELLKRPVRIESAMISYTGEIKIKGLRVTEPGPEALDFITADYIYATYRLRPLLQRRIEIDSIVLVAPSIGLINRADGSWNISDILENYRNASGGNLLNKIDSAEVKDGRVSVKNQKEKSAHSFEDFNLTLSNFKPGGDTPFYISVFFKSNALRTPVTGRLYSEGVINLSSFNWEEAELKDLRADITLQEKTLKLTGTVKNFLRPVIALKAESPSFKGSELDYLFDPGPKIAATPSSKFTIPASSWDLDSVFSSSRTAELRLLARPLNIRAEGTVDFSSAPLSYAFTVSAPPFTLEKLRSYGVRIPLENPSGKAHIRLRISSKNGKPAVSRFFINTTGAGFKHRNFTVSNLNMAALVSENFSSSFINATKGRLQLGNNKLSGLNLKLEISKNDLLVNYSGKFNGTQAKGRVLSRNPFTSRRTLNLTGYSEKLSYAEIKSLTFGIKELRGPRVSLPEVDSELAWLKTLKNSIPMGMSSVKVLYKAGMFTHEYMKAADFYLSANLKDFAGDISKIQGDISIRAGAGTFYDVQKTSEKDHVFYIFSLPLTFIHRMNRTGALKMGYKVKDISFSAIGGDYTADGGKVQIKNFYIDGKEFSAHVTGQLDFSNETLDLKIYTISDKYYSMGSLPEALTDSSGKPALAFTLKGRMAEPDFKMISPKQSGNIIKEAAAKGVDINFQKIDTFAGGKK